MKLPIEKLFELLETSIKLKATPGAAPAVSPEQLQSLIEEVIAARTKPSFTVATASLPSSNLYTQLC